MSNDFRPFFTTCIALLLAINLMDAGAEEPAADNAALRWTLNTADTTLTVGIADDQSLCIYELCGPDGWNWTGPGSPFPLVGRIDVAGTEVAPKWSYLDADRGEERRREGHHHVCQRRPRPGAKVGLACS